MNLTKEELAARLSGREIGSEVTKLDENEAREAGLLIVFGASDDLMEFRGLILDEFDCYEGGRWNLDAKGILPSFDDCEDRDSVTEFLEREPNTKQIEAVWCDENQDPAWTYKTDWPHASFEILEDGEVYCRGIVIDFKEVSK